MFNLKSMYRCVWYVIVCYSKRFGPRGYGYGQGGGTLQSETYENK